MLPSYVMDTVHFQRILCPTVHVDIVYIVNAVPYKVTLLLHRYGGFS